MKTPTASKPRALRPKQIRELYGIPQGTLHFYCTGLPEAQRLPSIKLPGQLGTGGKGVRMVMVEDLEKWLSGYKVDNSRQS